MDCKHITKKNILYPSLRFYRYKPGRVILFGAIWDTTMGYQTPKNRNTGK